jgi:hypothetical protein
LPLLASLSAWRAFCRVQEGRASPNRCHEWARGGDRQAGRKRGGNRKQLGGSCMAGAPHPTSGAMAGWWLEGWGCKRRAALAPQRQRAQLSTRTHGPRPRSAHISVDRLSRPREQLAARQPSRTAAGRCDGHHSDKSEQCQHCLTHACTGIPWAS